MNSMQDAEFTKLLRQQVRECSFDFCAAASAIRFYYSEKGRAMQLQAHEQSYVTLSEDTCREYFATDYRSIECTDHSLTQQHGPQTYDDVVKLQRRIEQLSRLNNSRVFERVYESLGITPGESILGSNDEVILAMERRAEERRLHEEVVARKEREAQEALDLQHERERLRNRFKKGSLDAEGVDPLAEVKSDDDVRYPFENEDRSAVPVNFNIHDLLNSKEFDELLNEIERSLENEPDDKNGGESELSEVLKYLEDVSNARASNLTAPLQLPIASHHVSILESGSLDESPAEIGAKSSHTLLPENKLLPIIATESVMEPINKQLGNEPLNITKADPGNASERLQILESSDEEDVDCEWHRRRASMKIAAISVGGAGNTSDYGAWKGRELREVACNFNCDGFADPLRYNDVCSDVSSKSDTPLNNQSDTEVDEEHDPTFSILSGSLSSGLLVSKSVSMTASNDRNSASFLIENQDSKLEIINTEEARDLVSELKCADVNVNLDDILLNLVPKDGILHSARGGLLEVLENVSEQQMFLGEVCDNLDGRNNSTILKHRRRIRKEHRFASSIAIAKSSATKPADKSLPLSVVASEKIYNDSHSVDIIAVTETADVTVSAEEVTKDVAISSIESSDAVMAPSVPALVSSLFENYLDDTNVKPEDILIWETLPLLQFSCDSINPSSDAMISAFFLWFIGFAIHTKVRVVGVLLSDYSNVVNGIRGVAAAGKTLNILVNCSAHAIEWEQNFLQISENLTLADIVHTDYISSQFGTHSARSMLTVPETTLLCNVASLLTFRRDEARYFQAMHSVLSHRSGLNTQNLSSISSSMLSDSLVASVLKPYLMHNITNLRNLGMFLRSCEEAGFRMVGLRSVFVSKSWLQRNRDAAHLLPSWIETCIRRNLECNNDELGLSSFCMPDDPAVFAIVATFYNSAGHAANVMRELLGPDDPLLARRTDPMSIRALYGDACDRDKNITFPLSISADHVTRETIFWLCGNMRNGLDRFFCPPPVRKVNIGIGVVFLLESDASSSVLKNALRRVQSACFSFLAQLFQRGVSVELFRSVGATEYDHICQVGMDEIRVFSATSENNQNMSYTGQTATITGDKTNSFFWVLGCKTVSGIFATDRLKAELIATISKFMKIEKIDYMQTQITIATGVDVASENHVGEVKDLNTSFGNYENYENELSAFRHAHTFGDDKSCFLSHEDVHLPDCLILVCSHPSISETHNRDSALQLFSDIYNNLLSVLVDLSIVGVQMDFRDEKFDSDLLICLRGFQIIENIDHAVMCAQRAVSQIGKMNCRILMSQQSGIVESSPSKLIRIVKGKQALELLKSRFSLSDLLSFGSISDMKKFVPRCYWSAGVDLDSQPGSMIYRSYFLPGNFDSTSVLIISLKDTRFFLEKVLSRVLKRLERAGLVLLMIKQVESREKEDWFHTMLDESSHEYSWDAQFKIYAADYFSYKEGTSHFAMLVKGVNVIGRLVSIVGPPRAVDGAQYPDSIVSSLSTAGPPNPILILATLSCRTVDIASSRLFGVNQEEALDLPALGSTLPYIRDEYIQGESRLLLDRLISLTTCDIPGLRGGAIADSISVTREFHTFPGSEEFLPATYDVSCLIITSALIEEVGLAAIIECLLREHLKITNMRTVFLDSTTAKKLLSISGHSSLSFHAPMLTLERKPVVFLAIEGSSHAILRLRSLTIDFKGLGGSIGTCLWKLKNGDWGIVASSSVRLARELVLFCFDVLHGVIKVHDGALVLRSDK